MMSGNQVKAEQAESHHSLPIYHHAPTTKASSYTSTARDLKIKEEGKQNSSTARESSVDIATTSANHASLPECNIRYAIRTPFSRSSTSTIYNFGPISELLKDGKTRREIEVGRTFPDRDTARRAGIHVSAMAGICGTADIGCPSIALSGGYEDNEDKIYTFDYTGAGGKCYTEGTHKSDRGEDQTWQSNNLALFRSYKLEYPIRVLRGHKSKSVCAPSYGYRYDGLYQIVFCWIQRSIGFGGQKVIKFAFQRLPDQPPIVNEGRRFPEDAFISKGWARSWIELPKHFIEVPKATSNPPEPAVVDLGDGLGMMTPYEWSERNRSTTGAGSSVRSRLPVSYTKQRHEPYVVPQRVTVTDAFGNPLTLNSSSSVSTEAVKKPVIQKIVKRVDPYAFSVYRKLVLGVRDPPPYLEWVKQCETAGKVIEIS